MAVRDCLASAGIYLALNVGIGLAFGFALGWGTREAFVVAGITGISSSAIVTKVVVELRRLSNPETPMILGIIVIEDLFLALYLAALAPVLGDASSAGEAALLFARALGFLIVLAVAARYGAPLVQKLLGAREDELLVVLFFGLALAVAGAAEALGVSEAIGAFMAGLLVSGTAVAPRVRKLVLPIRDAFAAVFFFAFGLAIDPSEIGSVAFAAIGAALLSLVLAVIAGITTARLNQLDRVERGQHRFHGVGPGRVRAGAGDLGGRGRPRRAVGAVRRRLRAHPRHRFADPGGAVGHPVALVPRP